jgi:nucleoside-diphosphate-sugar epimerase
MTNKGILILGCGYSGAVLAQRLAFKGQAVWGTTRTEVGAQLIGTRGATGIVLDAQDLSPLKRFRGQVHSVVSCIPPMMGRGGDYEDHTGSILRCLSSWHLKAFVYVSSTSVYGDYGGQVVTESSPCHPDSPRGRARMAIETEVLASQIPSMVVRPAGIYGRGRSQLHRMASGRYRLVAGGEAFTNRIHVEDLAAILEAAAERGKPGAIYLASDRCPATQRVVAQHVIDSYGISEPEDLSLQEAKVRLSRDAFSMVTNSKKLDPSHTLTELGVELKYPDYKTGLASIWRWEAPDIEALIATSSS